MKNFLALFSIVFILAACDKEDSKNASGGNTEKPGTATNLVQDAAGGGDSKVERTPEDIAASSAVEGRWRLLKSECDGVEKEDIYKGEVATISSDSISYEIPMTDLDAACVEHVSHKSEIKAGPEKSSIVVSAKLTSIAECSVVEVQEEAQKKINEAGPKVIRNGKDLVGTISIGLDQRLRIQADLATSNEMCEDQKAIFTEFYDRL